MPTDPTAIPQGANLLAAAEELLDSDPASAADRARQILSDMPNNADALRLLGAALRRLGNVDEANEAELAAIDASATDPELNFAGACLTQGRLEQSESVLRDVLRRRPGDVAAIRMLAEIAARFGHLADAEEMLRGALERAPGFEFARVHLAAVLHGLNRSGEALRELDKLGAEWTARLETKQLRASALARVGEYQAAISLYREIVAEQPQSLQDWTSLGFLQKIIGDEKAAITAYRHALEIAPGHGEAWYGLADMKTVSFSDDDVTSMEKAAASSAISADDRFQIQFALAKAYEDRKDVDRSFEQLRKANAARAAQVRHDPDRVTDLVDRSIELFTPEFMKQPGGNPAPDPIFVLGLPRSGSTLVEQILASHPLVEGTGELPDIISIARSLEPSTPVGQGLVHYPLQLADVGPEELERLGRLYLERTRVQRKTDRPFFIDKMPNNWLHVGLIKRILPNAKIVDTRRHPLACGLSNFKQYYARGQEFSYDLGHFGRYYRDYVRLMRHFDEVAPGAICRVIHEDLVADPEREVRRLLDCLGLEFDEACLRFHESSRPVRSASAQQVRQPIRADATESWRRFERYLAPLKEALGPTLEDWK